MPLKLLRASKEAQAVLTSKQLGDALEDRVVTMFRNLGKWRVRKDVKLYDSHGNLSQIDVVYGLLFPTYVECKNYASGKTVSLADVAKFKSVLQLNGIAPSRGLFVTTSSYVPRAVTLGIRTLDGKQLAELERRARRRLSRVMILRALALSGITLAIVMHNAPSLAEASEVDALQAGRPLGDVLVKINKAYNKSLQKAVDLGNSVVQEAYDTTDSMINSVVPHKRVPQSYNTTAASCSEDDDGRENCHDSDSTARALMHKLQWLAAEAVRFIDGFLESIQSRR